MATSDSNAAGARIGRGSKFVTGLGAEHRQIIGDWIDQLTAAAHPEPLACAVSVPDSFDRLICLMGGDAATVAPLAVDVMNATEAKASEQVLLERTRAKLKPTHLGTWLEASAGGFDAGWWLAQTTRVEDVRTIVPDSAAAELLWDWAEQHRVTACTELRRAINPRTPYTELTLVLAAEQSARAAAIADACSILGLEPFPADALALAATGSLSLCARLLEEGVNRLALIVADDPHAALSAAAADVPIDPSLAADFASAVGGSLERLEIACTNAGLQLDLYYGLTS